MKKLNYKRIFTTVLWIVAVAGLLTSLGFVSKSERNIVASTLTVNILNNEENFFLNEGDVKAYLNERGEPFLKKEYGSINIPELEKALNAHPAVENAEVFSDMNGEVRVDITQRTPVLRIINKSGESFYIDSQSRLMPLNENYSARVLVANGELTETYATRYVFSVDQISRSRIFSEVSLLDDVYNVAKQINADSTLMNLIHQIYVNKDRELELYPAVGNHRIVFGTAEDAAEKMNKLKLFYTGGLNKSDGWTKYSTINLKYKNLVVCTKK